jgi:hypothetical protein
MVYREEVVVLQARGLGLPPKNSRELFYIKPPL